MPEEQSLSLEETNKLRISLGLKPLQADPPASEKKGEADDETGYDAEERRAVQNWQKYQDELEKKAFREMQKEEIRKGKEAAKRFAKLEGKGLADEAEDEDAAEWVRKMKKRQKKLAKKMADELAARDAAAEKLEYTERDVRGLKVAHDEAELDVGSEMVLTLKDATIDELEVEGDELENIELGERERLKEKLELKKKKPVYNAYEDEVDEHGEKRILAHYDDEIDPKRKRKRFVLQGATDARDSVERSTEAQSKQVLEKLKLQPIFLDIAKTEAAPSDYLDPSEIKIRKNKKKKPRSTRKKDDEEALAPAPAEIDPSAMEIDDTPLPAKPAVKRNLDDMNFVDDEELQNSLALQRRTALKKRKLISKPEDIARQLREQSTPGPDGTVNGESGIVVDDDVEEEPGLIIDETTEFVSNLRAPVIEERKRRRSTSAKPSAVTSMADEEDEEGDLDMDRNQVEEEIQIKRETSAPPEITSTGLDEEHTLSRGIGATLAMLNQRGLIQRNEDTQKLLELQRERERFKAEKRLKQLEAEKRARLQREQDRRSGIFDKMSAKEREEYARWENKQRDQQEAKEMAARFKDYKPNVQLSYKDEFGREMTQKEAFKYLSHQFHGKGSGKAKTEKRLKKIEDEKKRLAASSLQASAEGLTSSMADKARKNKQAGVRLM
ncbi:SART-1 protein [Kalaharituber pfeilii]|nr:SART-1 protein [Kalaharituber pfeilii]